MHMCVYCLEDHGFTEHLEHIYDPSSTGDIILVFPNGDRFEMPDMVLHYVFDHQWLPPQEFIVDVLSFDAESVKTERFQTKGLMDPKPIDMKIGYLQGDFSIGEVTAEFKEKLVRLCEIAAKDYPWMVAPRNKEKKDGMA
ncbi:MAG: hypothetical protein UX47_C0004G0024 [Candidatus Collierbacteria bacterium GW2011_GWA2_46_26]|uniref:DUF7919 domain-containing protein n=1 Tax=Candidatus Collierbacteria bacterium GW2011_GWA2_46_26 TaxID=1618381 RepID=A0A0G1PKN4_9BACT|nr:MAG: hypothetical protein UX47_C0004G0024 [Candidatus Collierbacteria bacterium GW2011_GWA2_46_26]